LKKNHNKKNYMGKHYNNSQCLKEKNYKAKFLTSSILKNKVDKDNFMKKTKKWKKKLKNWKKTKKNKNFVAIHSNMWGKLKCFPHKYYLILLIIFSIYIFDMHFDSACSFPFCYISYSFICVWFFKFVFI